MKLSIRAELVYDFAEATQIIANLEASQTSDQMIISESLDVQPPARLLSDKTAYGDRRIRASLSGEVTIRYLATVETYKSVVKLTFAKGASLKDPSRLFNSSLEGNTRRAIDIHEGDELDEAAFKTLIRAAIALNKS
jgi:hypothetical protein